MSNLSIIPNSTFSVRLFGNSYRELSVQLNEKVRALFGEDEGNRNMEIESFQVTEIPLHSARRDKYEASAVVNFRRRAS